MGLALEVGHLADLMDNDQDGARRFTAQLNRLNRYLVSVGLKRQIEPSECEVFSCDLYGYSALHELRRVAAHLDLRGKLPTETNSDASEDPVVEEYGDLATRATGGLVARLLRRSVPKRHFDHLMLHSDAEGYYLPQDFEEVLFPPEDLMVAGGMVGSAVQLQKECAALAEALQIPASLDPNSDEWIEAFESKKAATGGWKRFAVASHSCLQLKRAADHSLKYGAMIVFC